MTDQKALPKPFILVFAVERILSKVSYSCCTTDTIYRIVKKFGKTESMCHKRDPFIH
jgi:hypothetical protein